MVFMEVDKNGKYILTKPIASFIFLSTSVGMGVVIFALILYFIIKIITSSGFSELNSSTEESDNERERIDDNDDLEDV